MSLNKNVLKKKYYIIIKYFFDSTEEGIEENTLSEEEIYDLAFGHLYTNASSIISALSGVGITGKILTSFELVELLYNAYNRDDSECFGIDKAVEAGYNEIYVDAQSAIDKKIEALNKEIQERAHEIAQNAIDEVVDDRKKEIEEIEENLDEIIDNLAVQAIQNESARIPEEIRVEAIKKIERKKGEKNVKARDNKKSRNTKTK